MRTINLTGLFTVLLSLFFSNGAMCQATVANNAPGAGRFLGFNAAGANLDFRTNNITRMRLMENGSATINTGLQTVNYNGFLGLSADPAYWSSSLSPQAPVSLLHLVGMFP